MQIRHLIYKMEDQFLHLNESCVCIIELSSRAFDLYRHSNSILTILLCLSGACDLYRHSNSILTILLCLSGVFDLYRHSNSILTILLWDMDEIHKVTTLSGAFGPSNYVLLKCY